VEHIIHHQVRTLLLVVVAAEQQVPETQAVVAGWAVAVMAEHKTVTVHQAPHGLEVAEVVAEEAEASLDLLVELAVAESQFLEYQLRIRRQLHQVLMIFE
jgi:hypothetical protein